MDEYLQATRLVDLDAGAVRETAARLVQGTATSREAAVKIYYFVRDEIKFGYNRSNEIPASEVLRQGYGQCNTKGILLAALLRAASVPARFHLSLIDKAVQRGVMPPLAYRFSPRELPHTWIEALLYGRWIVLEGVILDRHYFLAALRLLLESGRGMGYAIGLPSEVLSACADGSCIDWDGVGDVSVQQAAVVQDLGVVADPSEFFRRHGPRGLRRWLYEHHVSQEMTERAARIRRGEEL